MEGQQISFDVVGVSQEKVEKGRNLLNVSLDAAANMTLTINSLRDGFDNSDPPLHYHVKVIEPRVSTGAWLELTIVMVRVLLFQPGRELHEDYHS